MILYYCILFFFFQAEDGIRDLVRSRGLGDVYKRQMNDKKAAAYRLGFITLAILTVLTIGEFLVAVYMPVSYTHLTLPTSDLV